MRLLQIYLVQLLIDFVKCDLKEQLSFKNKNTLPYFKRYVERKSEDPEIESLHSDDLKTNLVSLFVDNVKEIFNDDDETEFYEPSTAILTTEIVSPIITIINETIDEDPKLTENVMWHENMSKVPSLVDYKLYTVSIDEAIKTEENLSMLPYKDIKTLKHFEEDLDDHTFTDFLDPLEPWNDRRSCIFCNNIISKDCNDPQNKLIPSVLCARDDDICYSQHTPFGIIDRGCFNFKRNLTTYVCSCNLCNHKAISEMPYIFLNKRDWVDNVIDLSHTRSFRKSVFKNMACLRCEVNASNQIGDDVEIANCLEGKIGNVPTQVCKENEICAVKTIREDGYIWRGCVSAPLYNYWFAFCDSDLCNYDRLVSLFDFI